MTDSIGQRGRRRGIARLLALCAVLLGLFLMHGSPANAAEGCHGTMSAPAALSAEHAGTAMASTPSSGMTHAAAQQMSAMSAMGGAMCVSTPARDFTTLPVAGLMAVIAVLAVVPIVGRPVALGRTGRRGPPTPGGRSLLLQVCIART
ncbi:hypothetical protein [Streptomyces sp. NBC_01361]|uniref:hypothetical protein n=1 Tax=Streptomyces sp. NBC_01361 TaxID=2903838 RepID=UPI002E31FDAC|nr:hypothetical protein [Streptomyces sp. NBC_01361]